VEYDGGFESRYREPLSELVSTEQLHLLLNAIVALEPDNQTIIRRRFGLAGAEQTLQEIGDHFRLTRERIRQREHQSLLLLRNWAEAQLGIVPEVGADEVQDKG
jgi:RNA polymerase sigma factor (sigma-70 family)